MPAAAVIPAPVAYAIVAVAERLAVVYPNVLLGLTLCVGLTRYHSSSTANYHFGVVVVGNYWGRVLIA